MYGDFLNDLKLINAFIDSQHERNKDFLIEVFLENTSDISGTINLVVEQKPDADISKNHSHKDVISLNTSLIMTGFCPPNNKATSNSVFYSDIAMSNLLGPWGHMDEAIQEGWWIMPLGWDSLDSKTKTIYKKLYKSKVLKGDQHEQ